MTAALRQYQARMRRVLDHIDRHLDGELDLDTLSGVAAFSKYHFHRQFAATLGISVHRYVQLARMKRASYQLAYRDRSDVTGIAMDAGYEAPDAFARAFRKRFGQSPAAFRKSPDWETWRAALDPLDDARSVLIDRSFTVADVTIRDMPAIAIAIMEHRGDPAKIGDTIRRFIAWRRACGLTPKTSPTFTIFHADPRTTPAADYRMALSVGTERPIDPDWGGIEAGVIPAGRCAVLTVVGQTDDLEPAALYLYRDWLPASGEEARDFPLYCQRLSFFPDVPEHEAVAELFLPLK